MTERRFDDRVAVITGSGRGLGFEYAKLLANLGAKVVINDNGSALNGSGGDISVAQQAADQIKAAGGEAIVCTASVATPEGGKEIVEAAMDSWGRIDILINNAGNSLRAMLDVMTYDDFRNVVDVHLLGAFHVAQPAYKHMRAAGYGRVVLTGSIGGLYTMEGAGAYGIAKSGMMGLCNMIAIEGADRNIKANIILPGAVTRMSEGIDITQFPPMGPEKVAPIVCYLAHEDCAVSAELYAAVAGRMARAYVTETRGLYKPE